VVLQLPAATEGVLRVAFLPFGPLTLTTAKPKAYKEHPVSLGEHLRKRRIEMGLLQKDVASRLGTNEWTYRYWERPGKSPKARFLPGIIAFLGYYPYPEPTTLGKRLLKQRRLLGYSQEQMGKLLSVNEATYRQWENGLCQPNAANLQLIERLCGSHDS
jgi:transcriptional regulator with XRE-family HTH domain